MVKRKILFVLHLPAPIHGAAMVGKFIKESKAVNASFDADYINLTTSTDLKKVGQKGISKLINLFKIQLKVIIALFSNRYDLTYMTLTAAGLGFYKDLLVVAVLKLFGERIVYHFHNKGVSENQQSLIHDIMYRFTFHNTKSILLSPRLYSDIEKYVSKEDVFFCPNGIPKNIEATMEPDRTERIGMPCSILYLSNMMVSKGVFVLLQACSILKDKAQDFECHFVGDWSEISEEAFNQYLEVHNLTKHVFAHGKKYGKDKIWFYNNFDVFVFPTLSETFGLVNLEAMEFGLPIISTMEGGIPDIIVEGETGFLVPRKDATALAERMELLIQQPALRNRMGIAGKQRFNDFYTLEKFENNFTNILNQVIIYNSCTTEQKKVAYSELQKTI